VIPLSLGLTTPFRYTRAEDCPDVTTHTPCPARYIAWHDWAQQMNVRHRQQRCPRCGFYAIWVRVR
jgi:hypothetical protein